MIYNCSTLPSLVRLRRGFYALIAEIRARIEVDKKQTSVLLCTNYAVALSDALATTKWYRKKAFFAYTSPILFGTVQNKHRS